MLPYNKNYPLVGSFPEFRKEFSSMACKPRFFPPSISSPCSQMADNILGRFLNKKFSKCHGFRIMGQLK